ncbi:superoxide dismutase [Lyngbya sp. CCY1209]|uniref:superoxide dismutase n=1 Tax=Lyngbya sp. CCY1209 TaxID=2886103 RepID=UPI002D200DC2|nr:superoxide dismutase [Lyngbya sp. CCY1209]MEB3884474.1 superoxide dismutase [Lyngbya sp. CCY1209]
MAFELPDLPYSKDALASDKMSADTLSYHHDKHHAAYVSKLNAAIEGTDMANMSLEEIIKATYNDSSKSGVFNNAAQVWNHSFFWKCMKAGGGGQPTGALADKINADFGSFDKFAEEFKNAAATQFGSGWAWLVLDNGTLKVMKTPNAVNPIVEGKTPLLTLDVWEHAYYLDFQNARPGFIDNFMNNLVNWDFVAENLASAS